MAVPEVTYFKKQEGISKKWLFKFLRNFSLLNKKLLLPYYLFSKKVVTRVLSQLFFIFINLPDALPVCVVDSK